MYISEGALKLISQEQFKNTTTKIFQVPRQFRDSTQISTLRLWHDLSNKYALQLKFRKMITSTRLNPSVICHDVVAFYPVKYRKFRSVTVAIVFFYFHSKVCKIILIGHCRDVECLLLLIISSRGARSQERSGSLAYIRF